MDLTHVHLLVTHLPVFGSLLGGLVLAFAIWVKSNETKIAAYGIFIVSSIGAAIAYLTGEAAEERIENISGVLKATIEMHEDSAFFAWISLIILGVISIVGIILTLRNSPFKRSISFVILLISFICFGSAARTGYLGGQIRHTEIASGTSVSMDKTESDDDD